MSDAVSPPETFPRQAQASRSQQAGAHWQCTDRLSVCQAFKRRCDRSAALSRSSNHGTCCQLCRTCEPRRPGCGGDAASSRAHRSATSASRPATAAAVPASSACGGSGQNVDQPVGLHLRGPWAHSWAWLFRMLPPGRCRAVFAGTGMNQVVDVWRVWNFGCVSPSPCGPLPDLAPLHVPLLGLPRAGRHHMPSPHPLAQHCATSKGPRNRD